MRQWHCPRWDLRRLTAVKSYCSPDMRGQRSDAGTGDGTKRISLKRVLELNQQNLGVIKYERLRLLDMRRKRWLPTFQHLQLGWQRYHYWQERPEKEVKIKNSVSEVVLCEKPPVNPTCEPHLWTAPVIKLGRVPQEGLKLKKRSAPWL